MTVRPIVIAALLLAQVGLLAWAATVHNPVYDEAPHLAAGIAKWRFGRFDLYRVNPPLVEMVAALPVLAVGHRVDWSRFSDGPSSRSEFPVGWDFAIANGHRSLLLFSLARLALIPLVLIGGWACFRWADGLWGTKAGLLSAALWCLSPTVSGNGALVTPDAIAASLGVLAGYLFWRWLREPTWARALMVGTGMGLVLLTKFTWLLLVPLWPILWFIYRLTDQASLTWSDWGRQGGQLAAILLLALYLINAGYGFERSFRPLSEFEFNSQALSGNGRRILVQDRLGNRFRNTLFADLPIPLPANYLIGIDVQKVDFEKYSGMYLHGEEHSDGVWYWYLYAMLVKEPVTLWVLLAIVLAIAPLPKGRDLLVLFAPAAGVLLLVSWNHSLCHYRYVLPALPFLFVLAGGAVQVVSRARPLLSAVVIGSLLWYAGSSLAVAPHWLSYFNEVAGGPQNGWKHLSGSALDWGQGLVDLKRWLDEHPEATPLHLAYVGNFNPHLVGIKYDLPPAEPQPGWYAVSAAFLADADRVVSADGEPKSISPGTYAYFRHFDSVYRAADVLYVYHITPEEAERVRRLTTANLGRDIIAARHERLIKNSRSARPARGRGAT